MSLVSGRHRGLFFWPNRKSKDAILARKSYRYARRISRNSPLLTASGCFPQLCWRGERACRSERAGWRTTFSPLRSLSVKRPISPGKSKRRGTEGGGGGDGQNNGILLCCRPGSPLLSPVIAAGEDNRRRQLETDQLPRPLVPGTGDDLPGLPACLSPSAFVATFNLDPLSLSLSCGFQR